MESFVGEQEEFVGDTVFDGKPVEALEGGGDVLPGFGPSKHSGSRVLDILQTVQVFFGESEQDTVAVVKAGGHKGVNESFCNRIGE